ncbi:SMI1/KNR4 family protein [Cellulomonas sp. HD19AZ1]|uniref:SMI1/KNR4 family protein n=1 Tax=Cellulomonas sp. HD19AZ1 TaxID=2559593 RepID=UPI001070F1A2|nr:SMI1/KNR4 family protein [Cellulomonas sp. HD19AZ1]TFH71749.1 SMI1/KNR4 family protein [Cellulomonas sp. HD19AZ1]
MTRTRWDVLLGEMGIVATQISQAAPGVYPLSAPRLGADEESIKKAEERLGHPLDDGFRELLHHADGWPGAFLDGDVLGTRGLGMGPLWERGNAALDQFYEYGLVDGLPARDQLYPIFVAPHQQDVMALRLDGPMTEVGHEVLWFANELVDRWPDVSQWWFGGIEIARQTLDYVLQSR